MNIKKIKIAFFIIFLWFLWVTIWTLVLYIQNQDIPIFGAFFSSIHYNFIGAILSIFVWKLCKRFSFEKVNRIIFILLHLLFGILFTVLWHTISYGWWYLLAGDIIFELVQFEKTIGWQLFFGFVIYFFITGVFYTIIYYRNYKEKELSEAELKILTRDAELKALKLQINPHFLFNSLNSISALITQNPPLARKMISQLSELLRMSLESNNDLMIPLQQELEFVHKYIDIEQIRFRDKMSYKEDIDPQLLTKPFPAMLLQPLIENAVKHGIANNRSGGEIELQIKNVNDQIFGIVINRTNEKTFVPNSESSNGTGIKNIRQRLDKFYGKQYKLNIDQSKKNEFKVIFQLPFNI